MRVFICTSLRVSTMKIPLAPGLVKPRSDENITVAGSRQGNPARHREQNGVSAITISSQPLKLPSPWLPAERHNEVAMNCPECRHENRPTARFCAGCGAKLQ